MYSIYYTQIYTYRQCIYCILPIHLLHTNGAYTSKYLVLSIKLNKVRIKTFDNLTSFQKKKKLVLHL